MIQLFIKGGWVMWIIGACSLVGWALAIEKFIMFAFLKVNDFEFVAGVLRHIKAGQMNKALDVCERNHRNPLAALFKIGVQRCNLPAERLEKVLEQAGNNQIQKMERGLGALATIITVGPLLGFLGTIVGLISAFMVWEKAGANITVNALASGIYQAMITTAAGLMVAIPLTLCYNYFLSRTKYIANDVTNHALQLIEALAESRRE